MNIDKGNNVINGTETLSEYQRSKLGHLPIEDNQVDTVSSQVLHFGIPVGCYSIEISSTASCTGSNMVTQSTVDRPIHDEKLPHYTRLKLGHIVRDDVSINTGSNLYHFGQKIGEFCQSFHVKLHEKQESDTEVTLDQLSIGSCDEVSSIESSECPATNPFQVADDQKIQELDQEEDSIAHLMLTTQIQCMRQILVDSEYKRQPKWFSRETQTEYIGVCTKAQRFREDQIKVLMQLQQDTDARLTGIAEERCQCLDLPVCMLHVSTFDSDEPHDGMISGYLDDKLAVVTEALETIQAEIIQDPVQRELNKKRVMGLIACCVQLAEITNVVNAGTIVQQAHECLSDLYCNMPTHISCSKIFHNLFLVESELIDIETLVVEYMCRDQRLTTTVSDVQIDLDRLEFAYHRAQHAHRQALSLDAWRTQIELCLCQYDHEANGTWVPKAKSQLSKPSLLSLPQHTRSNRVRFLKSMINESLSEFEWLKRYSVAIHQTIISSRAQYVIRWRTASTMIGKQLASMEPSEAMVQRENMRNLLNESRKQINTELNCFASHVMQNLLGKHEMDQQGLESERVAGNFMPATWLHDPTQSEKLIQLEEASAEERKLQLVLLRLAFDSRLGQIELNSDAEEKQLGNYIATLFNTKLLVGEYATLMMQVVTHWEPQVLELEVSVSVSHCNVVDECETKEDPIDERLIENKQLDWENQSLAFKQQLLVQLRTICWLLQQLDLVKEEQANRTNTYRMEIHRLADEGSADEIASLESMQLVTETQFATRAQGLFDIVGEIVQTMDEGFVVVQELRKSLTLGSIVATLDTLYNDERLLGSCTLSPENKPCQQSRDDCISGREAMNEWSQPRMKVVLEQHAKTAISYVQRRIKMLTCQIETLSDAQQRLLQAHQVREELRTTFVQRAEMARDMVKKDHTTKRVGPLAKTVAAAVSFLADLVPVQVSKQHDAKLFDSIEHELETLSKTKSLYKLKELRLQRSLAWCLGIFSRDETNSCPLLPPTMDELTQLTTTHLSGIGISVSVSPRSPKHVIESAIKHVDATMTAIRTEAQRSAGTRPSHLKHLQRAEAEYKRFNQHVKHVCQVQKRQQEELQNATLESDNMRRALGILETLSSKRDKYNHIPVEARKRIVDVVDRIKSNVESRRRLSVEIDLKELKAQDDFVLSGGIRRYQKPWSCSGHTSPVGRSGHKLVVPEIPNKLGGAGFESWNEDFEHFDLEEKSECSTNIEKAWDSSILVPKSPKNQLRYTVYEKVDKYSHKPEIHGINRAILQSRYNEIRSEVSRVEELLT